LNKDNLTREYLIVGVTGLEVLDLHQMCHDSDVGRLHRFNADESSCECGSWNLPAMWPAIWSRAMSLDTVLIASDNWLLANLGTLPPYR
jgi:hypothetical protein